MVEEYGKSEKQVGEVIKSLLGGNPANRALYHKFYTLHLDIGKGKYNNPSSPAPEIVSRQPITDINPNHWDKEAMIEQEIEIRKLGAKRRASPEITVRDYINKYYITADDTKRKEWLATCKLSLAILEGKFPAEKYSQAMKHIEGSTHYWSHMGSRKNH